MNRFRVATAVFTIALTGTCMSAASAADDATSGPGAETVWVTDFSGRPPFARRAVSAAEFARFEETKPSVLPAVGERCTSWTPKAGRRSAVRSSTSTRAAPPNSRASKRLSHRAANALASVRPAKGSHAANAAAGGRSAPPIVRAPAGI
jgi:hypothetical protein